MKRIILFLWTIIALGLAMPASASAIDLYYDGEYHTYTGTLYKLYVNGNELSVPLEPITFNNRSLVPIREVFEALGARVDYISETKDVIVTANNTRVQVQVGNNTAYVNGNAVAIPDGVVPKLITKVGAVTKTMVPVRFISEQIGLKVDFDGVNGAIKISGSVGNVSSADDGMIRLNIPQVVQKDDKTTVITVTTDKPMATNVKPVISQSGVLYFDIVKGVYEGVPRIDVNHEALAAVRLGQHEGFARVAFDIKNYNSYSVVTDATKKMITITVVAVGGNPVYQPETGLPEEKPVELSFDVAALKNYTASNGIKYVVIDAGHGGKDSGAVGSIQSYVGQIPGNDIKYYEKNINLAIARIVQEQLQAAGINVIMTRSDDSYPTLSERAVLANQIDAAMFVSIHVNSATNATANGIEVFYAGKNNNDYYGLTSQALAGVVLDQILAQTGARNRGVKTENHLVTRTSIMPAVLVEVGFISNEEEIRRLIDPAYQQKLANGISAGIISQLGNVTVPERYGLVMQKVADEIGNEKAVEYMNEVWK